MSVRTERIPFAGGDWEPRLRVKGSCVTNKEASTRKGLLLKLHRQERDSMGQRRYLAPQEGLQMVRNGHWIPPDQGAPKVKGKLPTTKPNGMCLPALPRESPVPVEGCGGVFSPPSQDRRGMLNLQRS